MTKSRSADSPFQRATSVFKKQGGILRASQALRAGIHPETLYSMRDSGELEAISRGLYRLKNASPLGNPDLVTVATRVSSGVICLISALAFHELTTQIPHQVHIALPRGAEEPRIDHPPIKTYRFAGGAFKEGVEDHKIDGIRIRIYSPEKTIADCFKFRNKIGLDTAIEALRFYRDKKKIRVKELMHFAELCRITKIITPYIEAVL